MLKIILFLYLIVFTILNQSWGYLYHPVSKNHSPLCVRVFEVGPTFKGLKVSCIGNDNIVLGLEIWIVQKL
jgi:hypothetical protein